MLMDDYEHLVQFSLSLPVAKRPVDVIAFEGQEVISGPSCFRLDIALPLDEDGSIPDHRLWLFEAAHFVVAGTRLHRPRYFHGLITAVTLLDRARRHQIYRIQIEPALMLLSYQRNYRVFHQQGIASILAEILDQVPLLRGNYQLDLRNEQLSGEYRVQYDESDLAFIQRLMAEAGVFYYFSHREDGCKLIIADSGEACIREELTLPYVADGRPVQAGEPVIESLHYHQALTQYPCRFRGFDYLFPDREVLISVPGSPGQGPDLPAEYYWGDLTDAASIGWAAEAKVNAERMRSSHGVGQSNCPLLSVGTVATINGHPVDGLNGEWLFWEVIHSGRQHQALEEGSSNKSLKYHNRFRCQHAGGKITTPVMPATPVISGPQTATVTGPEPGRIYTDELGRIKLMFHWGSDRSVSARTSRWVRVSQISAGEGWGAGFLPRVGQEVLVEYEHGNPERPVVTGVVYNGRNRPEHFLPDQYSRSLIRSSFFRHRGKYSELAFEDGTDHPGLALYSDGDIRNCSQGDQLQQAGGHWQQYIQGDCMFRVDGEHHLTVKGAWRQSLRGDCHSEISGDRVSRCDGDISEDCGESYNLKANGSIVLSAEKSLTLRVGDGFLRLAQDGLYLSGSVVKINSGGKADPVSVATPESPRPPVQAPEEQDEPDELITLFQVAVESRSPAATSLAQASRDHTPFIERCKST